MAVVEEQSRPRRTRMPAARRRETILHAAAEVFATAGYRAAKMSDIAARVGVTEPVVFQNFGSKPALFAAVVEHAAAQARSSLEEAAARPGSAGPLLAHVLGDPLTPDSDPSTPDGNPSAPSAEHHPPGRNGAGPGFAVLFADAVAMATDPALAEVSGQAMRSLAGHLADIVRSGQRDGSVRADADPEAAAWLLISLLAARPLRDAAMPPAMEPKLAGLALLLLGPAQRRR